jgi:putative oxidoreductase
MTGMGLSVPPLLQALAALVEFVGGAMLILGLLSPIVAFALACQMLAAMFMVHFPHGDAFVTMGKPSYELAMVYFAQSVAFLTLGPGSLSLDYVLFGKTPVRDIIVESEDMTDIHRRAA